MSVLVLTESLPWHLTYHGFFEELPAIEGINVGFIGMSIRLHQGPCLFSTEVGELAGGALHLSTSTGQVTSLVADPILEIDLENPAFLCELWGDIAFSGSATVRDKSGNLLFIELV